MSIQGTRLPPEVVIRSWNHENPKGTTVRFRRAGGASKVTHTRSEAYLHAGVPVVLLVAFASCRPVSRCQPLHGLSCTCDRCRAA